MLEILEADAAVAARVSGFRLGDLGEHMAASQLPLVYVTLPGNPEVSRRALYPAGPRTLAVEQRITELWAVVLASGATPGEAQTNLYEITGLVSEALGRNVQLRDAAGEDPLCMTATVEMQRRYERNRGATAEGMTVRFRAVNLAKS